MLTVCWGRGHGRPAALQFPSNANKRTPQHEACRSPLKKPPPPHRSQAAPSQKPSCTRNTQPSLHTRPFCAGYPSSSLRVNPTESIPAPLTPAEARHMRWRRPRASSQPARLPRVLHPRPAPAPPGAAWPPLHSRAEASPGRCRQPGPRPSGPARPPPGPPATSPAAIVYVYVVWWVDGWGCDAAQHGLANSRGADTLQAYHQQHGQLLFSHCDPLLRITTLRRIHVAGAWEGSNCQGASSLCNHSNQYRNKLHW